MCNAFGVEFLVTLEDLAEHLERFGLVDVLAFLDDPEEVAAAAEFRDNIEICGRLAIVDVLQHV